MALVKPLVITAGQIQRIQSGDTIDPTYLPASTGTDVQSLTNKSGGGAIIGQAVFISGAGEFDLAQADALASSLVVGLVQDATIANDAAGDVQVGGVVTASTTQWDAVAGTTGGLTAGKEYFLSPDTAGSLEEGSSADDGEVVAAVGVALSTTQLRLGIKPTVLL